MDTDPARDLILRAFLFRLVELYGPTVAVQFLEAAAAAIRKRAGQREPLGRVLESPVLNL